MVLEEEAVLVLLSLMLEAVLVLLSRMLEQAIADRATVVMLCYA